MGTITEVQKHLVQKPGNHLCSL